MDRGGKTDGGDLPAGVREVISVLACPVCDERGDLVAAGAGLVCSSCGRTYRLESGIPLLLPEDAMEGESV